MTIRVSLSGSRRYLLHSYGFCAARFRQSPLPTLPHSSQSTLPYSQSRSSLRNMSSGPSTATHPVSSTSDEAPPAEGLNPVTPGASATKTNGDAGKEGKPKQEKPGKKEKKAAGGSGGGGGGSSLELHEPPGFFAERIKIYDEWKAKYDQRVAGELVWFNLVKILDLQIKVVAELH